MARPRKIAIEQSNLVEAPQEAPVSLSEVFLLKDPTSRANTRIVRVHSAEECDRFIKRGWIMA